jgi:radical SAM superfamily enzyme YgiQ (UPF0313 family)
MELPRRDPGDELLRPGELADIRLRLRNLAAKHDLATVIVHAFDDRTRMLPFIHTDRRMAPGGVRAIGAAMVDAGFYKTRIVLQQWNKNFRPSQMRLDGRIPDLFMVSSMQLHSAPCDALIRDACRIDLADRPLIIAGGPRVIYQPWEVFASDSTCPWGADVAVTGEEYVLLSLLEVLLSIRANGESIRSAFIRARDCGDLDAIPGLVYARNGATGVTEELIDTGVQRLLGDLDELPHPALGYRLLEPPSDGTALGPHALPPGQVRKHCRIASLIMTLGCKFGCPYCPIPAYNQRQYRVKSGERISDEMERIYNDYGISFFFGADDNFFNDRQRTLDITETLARNVAAGSRPHCKIRWGTEATIHDTLAIKEHLPVVRKAGLWALWLGVEDMTGALVKKGQSTDKTLEAFRLLRQNGIFPIPMLMHHDSQPLYTWNSEAGLLNQVRQLRKAGAVHVQIMMLTPAPGSRSYEEAYSSGLAFQRVNGIPVEPRIVDGNHVVASRHPRPWTRQMNLLAAYFYFYNPLRLLVAMVCPKTKIPLVDAETSPPEAGKQRLARWKSFRRWARRRLRAHFADAAVQLFGMWALAHTASRTLGWCWRLLRGNIQRHTKAPVSPIPMRSVDGGPASHALPEITTAKQRPLRSKPKATIKTA